VHIISYCKQGTDNHARQREDFIFQIDEEMHEMRKCMNEGIIYDFFSVMRVR
jgi:hypothetical protein